jgi:hypothetical protein
MQMSVGTMPHAQIMHSIELLGNVVAPAVRKALGVAASQSGAEQTGAARTAGTAQTAAAQAR